MITKKEWGYALLVALAATLMMQVPYGLGYALAPSDTEYTGLLINVEDYSYYAIMLQGSNGAWQYHIQYTTELHAPAFLYGFYLFLGHLARAFNVSVAGMWHAARIVAAFALLMAVFAFSSFFLDEPRQRWTAYLLAIFGSGFDWSLFPWERFEPASATPLDFRMPEMHLFYTALTYPHITLGIALILGLFWLWLRWLAQKRSNDILASAVVTLLISIIYPFLIFLVAGVLGLHWAWLSVRAKRILWRDFSALTLAFSFAVPLNLYYAYVLQTNPVFRIWNDQAATLSPNPLHYLLASGVMLMLAAPMLRAGVKDRFAFLWVWIAVVALLLYSPLGAQRRFALGVQVPLSILATLGLYSAILPRLQDSDWFQRLMTRPNYSRRGLERLIVAILLLLVSAANLIVWLKLSALTALEQPAAFFVPRAELAAMDWLGANTQRDDAVLAAYWTGALIPARVGNVVFMGQHYETNRFADKQALVERFFATATDDAFRRDLLAQFHIAYVFWSEQERALGTFDPSQAGYLDSVFSNSTVTIYRVK
jgi:hypothetical protein